MSGLDPNIRSDKTYREPQKLRSGRRRQESEGPYPAALECPAISTANPFAVADLTLMRSLRRMKKPLKDRYFSGSAAYAEQARNALSIPL